MIRGILFDLGNTLMYCDASHEELEAVRAAALLSQLRTRGAVVGETFATDFESARRASYQKSIVTNVENPTVQILSDTLGRHAVCYLPDAVIPRLVSAYFAPEYRYWHAYPDAHDTLAGLRGQGLKLGLLSNSGDDAFIRHLVALCNLTEFFDPFCTSAALGFRKPDSRAFQPILDAWQLTPKEIMMVGDLPQFDILGAHRVGMPAALIAGRWTELEPANVGADDEPLLLPDFTIRQLAELPALLSDLNA